MGLFRSVALPPTSYGYFPPAGATARGWTCTNWDCGVSEVEHVRRWPKSCSACGAAADPLLDAPWSHDAEGVELQWLLRTHPERGGGYHQDQWMVWQLKDAWLRDDREGMTRARLEARRYAADRLSDGWWGPGNVFFQLTWLELEAGDLQGAAEDLRHWLGLSSSADAENDNTNRTNCRQVIDIASRFFAAPGAERQPLAPDIRRGCLQLAEGAYQVLLPAQQQAVLAMSRAER